MELACHKGVLFWRATRTSHFCITLTKKPNHVIKKLIPRHAWSFTSGDHLLVVLVKMLSSIGSSCTVTLVAV